MASNERSCAVHAEAKENARGQLGTPDTECYVPDLSKVIKKSKSFPAGSKNPTTPFSFLFVDGGEVVVVERG